MFSLQQNRRTEGRTGSAQKRDWVCMCVCIWGLAQIMYTMQVNVKTIKKCEKNKMFQDLAKISFNQSSGKLRTKIM
jgi:hypothetical protein